MKLGITGTRNGLTDIQHRHVVNIARNYKFIEVHHGDCMGVDDQVTRIIKRFQPDCNIVTHPPTNSKYRAYTPCNQLHSPRPYLIRNEDIVEESDILIAFPKEHSEVIRSGTWATIRHARAKGIPVIVVYPNAKVLDIKELINE